MLYDLNSYIFSWANISECTLYFESEFDNSLLECVNGILMLPLFWFLIKDIFTALNWVDTLIIKYVINCYGVLFILAAIRVVAFKQVKYFLKLQIWLLVISAFDDFDISFSFSYKCWNTDILLQAESLYGVQILKWAKCLYNMRVTKTYYLEQHWNFDGE